ncbi:hypothetical protein GCM10025881_29410 [Pseudolysinimonas kribbensis]|uniref:Uncharacterized protein n=1 Tax=Pseudolysinimonas kribbensis TaxID=433641 RepID=A0ABQ6K674_9MICO|nr:hypothetical protein GCM10025881_29410 [Pseudolysinimonas kribbensis]
MARIADIPPIAEGTRRAGNASRSRPKASGNIAPPRPWITRAMSSTPSVGAVAAMREPSATAATVTRKVRRRPTRSPTRPSSGVATAAEMSHAVMAQVTPAVPVCRSAWMAGSTGTMSDWRVEKEATLRPRAANVRIGVDEGMAECIRSWGVRERAATSAARIGRSLRSEAASG